MRVAGIVLAVFVLVGGAVGAAQEIMELPIGQTADGTTGPEMPATFRFTAESAGVLTVVVHAQGEGDLSLLVADDAGQPLRDGTADMDRNGNVGDEILSLPLTSAGDYHVMVKSLWGEASFRVAASWVPFAELALPADPDGKPTAANQLMPGSPLQDSINSGEGDEWDWFVVTPDMDGIVTVLIESDAGDLVLEAYNADDFTEPVTSSDQDMEGISGNESVTVRATAGQAVYIKVKTYYGSGEAIPYSIRAGVM